MTTAVAPTPRARRVPRIARVALIFAVVWAAGLVVAAIVAPIYRSSSSSASMTTSGSVTHTVTHSSSTLMATEGPWVLVPIGAPLAIAAAVAWSLHRRPAEGHRGPGPVALAFTGLLGLFTLLAMLTIGVFVVPVTVALVIACLTTDDAPVGTV